MDKYILEMKGISKEFPGVKALENVNFSVKKGEIHALVGENGAGKSTLIKVLSGVYPYHSYGGDIIINGAVQRFHSIKDSEKAGIAVIYQELTLVKLMTVYENLFLGDEKTRFGILNKNEMISQAQTILNDVKLNIKPDEKVISLGIGKQQLVEIAKALLKKAEILVLDEPTAALNESESRNLLEIIKHLSQKGVTCIFITHRLKEAMQISDRITVLRDGKTVTTEETTNLTEKKVISYMVGRELTQMYPRQAHTAGDVVLEVRNWTVFHPVTNEIVCKDLNFVAKKGELLGIAGLMGAGRTELAMSLLGLWGRTKGELLLEGKPVKFKSPSGAIRAGISLLTEDRKRYGLNMIMDIKENMTLASLDKISKLLVINSNEEIKVTENSVASLKIKTPGIDQKAKNLSGGNQQKVIIGKWLLTKPKVLILDEPTRGIDVGAKVEIYNIINQLIEQGVCVIMISSELPEILGMADRILVIHEGKLSHELPYTEATQEKIMYYATGGK
ncbi:MAG: xylose ABC transporter ATP-binding protein [Bacillota bacterium]